VRGPDTPPSVPPRILVIDHNPDSGELLVRSLRRKFPDAFTYLTSDAEDAEKSLAALKLDAIVIHRANTSTAVELTRALRRINPTVPIVVVSGIDRSEAVFQAGATGFINFDQWLMIGPTVANAMAAAAQASSDASPEHKGMSVQAR
jgi:DNA-binding NarL/FixJ family response regulator